MALAISWRPALRRTNRNGCAARSRRSIDSVGMGTLRDASRAMGYRPMHGPDDSTNASGRRAAQTAPKRVFLRRLADHRAEGAVQMKRRPSASRRNRVEIVAGMAAQA